jgi:hypothetical protein
VVSFPDLLESVTAPEGRKVATSYLPDLSLRALSFVTGDTKLAETDWQTLFASTHPHAYTASAEQSRDARDAIHAIIFGSGSSDLGAWNETFGKFHLEDDIAPYREFLKTGGWRKWLAKIEDATSDGQLVGSSYYSDPNPKRARQEKERLLRENGLAVRRTVGLSIADTLEKYSTFNTSPERRGPGRPPKNVPPAGHSPEPPQLIGAVGNYYLIECGENSADRIAAAITANLTELFAKNFPSFPLKIEPQIL